MGDGHRHETSRAPIGGAPVANVDPAGSARTRQILDERYARGELNIEDYTERVRTLGL